MASIEERSNNWRVYWRQGGRDGKKQSTTWSDPGNAAHAKRIADAHRNRISAREVYAAVNGIALTELGPARPVVSTVAEWADIWLAAKTRITPGQRGRYRAQLDNEILPRIGALRLDEVNGTVIATLLQDLGATRKNNTVDRYYACLHGMFRYAELEGKITSNPARRTDWVRGLIAHDDIGDEGHVYLTRREYLTLRDAADEDAHALLDTLADTGARWSEVTALDVRDIDLFARTPGIRIAKAWKQDDQGRWYRGATKGRNRRFVPIPRRLVNRLVPLVANRPPGALLFTAPRGGRVVYSNWRNRMWLPALARAARCTAHPPTGAARRVDTGALAGPRCGDNGGTRSNGKACAALVTPGWDRCASHHESPTLATSTCECPGRLLRTPTIHDLRHSLVAWLIAAGRPLLVISRRIGHHSITITERVYAGILPDVDSATAAALDAADDELAAVATGPVERVRTHRHRVVPRRRLVSRHAGALRGSA